LYKVSFGDVQLPVAPSKITMKTKNNNKTLELINGDEINFIRTPGLTEYSFEFLIPHVKYPFAEYPDGFKAPGEYFDTLKRMKTEKKSFSFKISRTLPNGETSVETNKTVTLEDYTITDDTSNGLDFTASVTLKEYQLPKTIKNPVVEVTENGVVVKEETQRESDKDTPSTYTVKSGDTLWKICKAQLGDGAKYGEIAELNSIPNPNLIYVGQVIKLGTT
jgi:LysM repeat protein